MVFTLEINMETKDQSKVKSPGTVPQSQAVVNS